MRRWLILFLTVMLFSPLAYAKNKKQDANLKENALLSHTFQHSESCLDSIGCGVRPSKKSCGLSELKRL